MIDAGQPRNAPAAGVHGFLSRDGMSPQEVMRAVTAFRDEHSAASDRVTASVS